MKRIITIVVFAAAMLFSCIPAFSATKKTNQMKSENTFVNPDFAYPQTVEKNAEAVFRKEMGKLSVEPDSYVEALRAAMQIVIARNAVSKENAAGTIVLMDSIANVFDGKPGFGKTAAGLARLIEAQIYSNIYLASPWVFNNRTLPAEKAPADPMEWSRDNFSVKITGLVSKAISGIDAKGKDAAMPIDTISSILSDYEQSSKMGFTIYDFMVSKSVDVLSSFADDNNDGNVIPFFNGQAKGNSVTEMNASTLRAKLIDSVIEKYEVGEPGKMLLWAVLQKSSILNGREKLDFLCHWEKTFINTKYCAGILFAEYKLLSSNYGAPILRNGKPGALEQTRLKSIYNKIKEYMKAFPNDEENATLRYAIENMSKKNINIALPDLSIPDKAIEGKISCDNVNDLYLLIFKVADSNWTKGVRLSAIGNAEPVQRVKVIFDGVIPFKDTVDFRIDALKSGTYAIVPSTTNTIKGVFPTIDKNSNISTFVVTGLSSMKVVDQITGSRRFYAVDSRTQKPVEGAIVKWTTKNGKKKIVKSAVTNKSGYVEIPNENYDIEIRKGRDFCYNYSYREYPDKPSKNLNVNVLTDLSVYKPGDTIKFVAVAYEEFNKELSLATGREFKVYLDKGGGQQADSLSLVTDSFGRISGEFRIPESGFLGSRAIRVVSEQGKNTTWKYFEVAEYKMPTFFVTIGDIKGNYKIGDTLKINGEVRTYSGMPVSGANVAYDIRYQNLWWMPVSMNANYGATAVTDKDGKFMLELPTEGLRGTDFAFGKYVLNVSATSPAGETQSASPASFSIGEAYSVSGVMPEKICMDNGAGEFKINVNDILGHPIKKNVTYSVRNIDSDKVVMSGEFESPLFKIDLKGLGAGKFVFTFKVDTENSNEWSHEMVVWTKGEKQPPFKTVLWVEENEIKVKSGTAKVEVPVGTSYDNGWILAVVSNKNGIISEQWIKPGSLMRSLKVDAPSKDDRVSIMFSALNDFTSAQQTVVLIPEEQLEKLEIKTDTFRDRLTPGEKEKWSFSFVKNGIRMSDTPAMAVMTNKALDKISPFKWNLNPYNSIYWSNTCGMNLMGNNILSRYFSLSKYVSLNRDNIYKQAGWQTYNIGFYNPGIANRKLMIRGARPHAETEEVLNTMAVMEAVAVREPMMKSVATAGAMDLAEEEAVEDASYDGDAAAEEKVAEEPLRDVECPLAFFMPELVADKDGNLTVNFEVPDFNTTWKFQLVGYDRDLKGASLVLDAVAAKPVMVSMNAPRFIRTGDEAYIAATLYNNSERTAPVGGRFVIFDPVSGKVIKEQRFEGSDVEASGSRTIRMEFTPGSDLNMIGIRAYASMDNFSDGEQTVIPVLPSSSAVIDSETFYMEPGAGEKSVKVPSKAKDATVTLQYCDNPIWECVTALPDISNPDSENILSIVYALYGNVVSSGLASKYPQIPEALKLFADPANSGDSTLVSNLQKNASLKIVALDNTPWVNNAVSETLRMSRLTELADPANAAVAVKALMDKVSKKQKADGGWSWCDGMESSNFITSSVVAAFGELKRMGFMPEEAKKLIVKAVKYCDAEWVKDAKKHPDTFNPANMAHYIYIRQQFNVTPGSDFSKLQKRCLESIKKDWKDMGVYYKAESASILFRNGYKADALKILESLRQYASSSPEKGMWWDNLNSGFGGYGKLSTTAMVLNTWHEISPLAPEVDRIRQWLLLQKQTGEWGDNRYLSNVITSIITTGSEWLKESAAPEITIGGKPVDLSHIAKLTGSMTLQLDKAQAGSEISIRKHSASPSWGGVISQYVAPVASVKAEKVPQLSITKDVLLIKETENGTEAVRTDRYSVGDKVRVTLTIKAGQDIDYVAVTDERAACMEPVDQLSGYTSTDRLWYYQETRDTATNLFIGFLPKGTYVVTYDCHIDREGEYALGIATAQSQYAPLITAHSAGKTVTVK